MMTILTWLINHTRIEPYRLLAPSIRPIKMFVIGAGSLLLGAGGTVPGTATDVGFDASGPMSVATAGTGATTSHNNLATSDPTCNDAENGAAALSHGCDQYASLRELNPDEYAKEVEGCGGCILVSVCRLKDIDFKFTTITTDDGQVISESFLYCDYGEDCGTVEHREVVQ